MGERSGAPRASALHQSSFRNLRLRFNYRSQMSQLTVTHPNRDLGSRIGGALFRGIFRRPELQFFYDAPALIVISTVTATPWAIEDCSLAAENLMLTAHAIGLGTCWVGVTQRWLGTPEGKAALNLPITYACSANHRWASKIRSSAALQGRAGNKVDRIVNDRQRGRVKTELLSPARSGRR